MRDPSGRAVMEPYAETFAVDVLEYGSMVTNSLHVLPWSELRKETMCSPGRPSVQLMVSGMNVIAHDHVLSGRTLQYGWQQ